MQEFNTYLFDFDGTLVDSHDSLFCVFKGAYGSVGVNVGQEHILRLMRVPLYVGYKELNAPEDDESKKLFGDRINELLDDVDILKLTKSYSDTLSTLQKLHKEGKTLGIVTSNNVKHVREVLEFLNIPEDYFQVIVGNEQTKKHKPNPDPILKALELLNISKEGVCYVGDGMDDKRSAINAGVTPILIDRLDQYDEEPGIVIKSLLEL